MMRMIMPAPEMPRIEVRHQQALSVMPARAEDIVILLALRGPLLLAQAIPFKMRMPRDTRGQFGRDNHAIAGSFEEEAVIDIGEAIEAELLVDPADLRQQVVPESHQIALDGIDVGPRRLVELAQIVRDQAEGAYEADGGIGERRDDRLPDIAAHFDRRIQQQQIAPTARAHGRVAPGAEAQVAVGEEDLQAETLAQRTAQIVLTR